MLMVFQIVIIFDIEKRRLFLHADPGVPEDAISKILETISPLKVNVIPKKFSVETSDGRIINIFKEEYRNLFFTLVGSIEEGIDENKIRRAMDDVNEGFYRVYYPILTSISTREERLFSGFVYVLELIKGRLEFDMEFVPHMMFNMSVEELEPIDDRKCYLITYEIYNDSDSKITLEEIIQAYPRSFKGEIQPQYPGAVLSGGNVLFSDVKVEPKSSPVRLSVFIMSQESSRNEYITPELHYTYKGKKYKKPNGTASFEA